MLQYRLEEKYNSYMQTNVFYLYSNNYKFEIGNLRALKLFYTALVLYRRGIVNNDKNPFFKISYNVTFLYIYSRPKNKSIGIAKECLDDIITELEVKLNPQVSNVNLA